MWWRYVTTTHTHPRSGRTAACHWRRFSGSKEGKRVVVESSLEFPRLRDLNKDEVYTVGRARHAAALNSSSHELWLEGWGGGPADP